MKLELFENKEAYKSCFKIDFNFQTPIKVAEYMVNMIPENAISILEPTPGKGNIVEILRRENKYKITAADDFFLLNDNLKFDCVVMNPPFSSKSGFLENAPNYLDLNGMKLGYHILNECIKKSNNIIALMPWFTISDSDVRLRNLKKIGIKSLTVLPRKTFEYARIQTVIIEIEKGYKKETIFRTL